jgi:carbon-monoxide dehydrogenase medium subunit
MAIWKNYYLADSPQDALEALETAPGDARVVAGGTDLLLELQQGLHPPVDTLVDVSAIAEMNIVEMRPEGVFVGASVPLNKLVKSPLIAEHAQALLEAASLIGGPQVRNTATLGGNVAHALPAADGTISLLALDAQAQIFGSSGYRLAPIETLFLGPGRSALDPCKDLLVGFYLPRLSENSGSAFRRVMRPQGVAIAILNMSVWIKRAGDRIADVRLAVGPGGPTPLRARTAEDNLRGQEFTPQILRQGLAVLQEEVRFRTSRHRATREYRHQMAEVLYDDTLGTAWLRASGEL